METCRATSNQSLGASSATWVTSSKQWVCCSSDCVITQKEKRKKKLGSIHRSDIIWKNLPVLIRFLLYQNKNLVPHDSFNNRRLLISIQPGMRLTMLKMILDKLESFMLDCRAFWFFFFTIYTINLRVPGCCTILSVLSLSLSLSHPSLSAH